MSPSLEETELTAAPYRGNGLGCDVVKVNRRRDHGYRFAFGVTPFEGACPFGPGRVVVY